MQKIRHGEIQAVAGGKTRFEFAVGCLTGESILFDFKTGKTVAKFPSGENKKLFLKFDELKILEILQSPIKLLSYRSTSTVTIAT